MGYPFKQARNYTKGRRKKIRVIVIHDMEAPEAAQTAENVAAWMAGSTAPQASYHYGVDADSVVQIVRDYDTAWHCPNANADGLGVEPPGYAKQVRREWTDAYSAASLRRSARLTASLAKKYGIPVRRLTAAQIRDGVSKGFVGHVDVSRAFDTPGGHVDPGPFFPWDVYLKMVQIELDALNGRKWTSSAAKRAAAALGVAIAVFTGVTVTNDPAPKPPVISVVTTKPTPTKTTPAPAATPVVKPKPVAKPAPQSKTLGAFPLPAGQWYGARKSLSANHSGYFAKDRAAVVKIQRSVGAAPDGRFGPATAARVRAKQKALGITSDGLVGKRTWGLLRLP